VRVGAEELVVGRATPVTVDVRNVADADRGIGAFGHCGGPGGLVDPTLWPDDSTVPTWDPAEPVADALRAVHLPPPRLTVPGLTACDASLPSYVIGPGEARTWTGVLDLRVGPQPVGTATLEVRVTGATATTRSAVALDVRLPIRDERSRQASYDAAIDAFAASTDLAAYAEPDPRFASSPASHQLQLGLSWSRGQWELTVGPALGKDGYLHERYDPTVGEIVDIRIVPFGYSPMNDPTAPPRPDGSPLDLVIKSASGTP
jgi:hypothetical protein